MKINMFFVERLTSKNAPQLAEFINGLREKHWTLTSLGYLPKPNPVPCVTCEQLMEIESQTNRVGTFILKCRGEIISVLQIDDKNGDREVAVISGVETDPRFQRRGTCWWHLIKPCLIQTCLPFFDRLEALTWVFNRKGIPLYKRIGFRALPGTSLLMENYIPTILKHPQISPLFHVHDVFRNLRVKRSYGYDDIVVNGVSVFEYRWELFEKKLIVYIDFQEKKIMAISLYEENTVLGT